MVAADKAANNAVVVCRLHYINTLKQALDDTRAYQETDSDEMSVVNAHLNELPDEISVRVNEGQNIFLRCIGHISFTTDRIKLDLLPILTLVLLLNFLNYYLPVLLLSNLMSNTKRRCMKFQIKIGFGQ